MTRHYEDFAVGDTFRFGSYHVTEEEIIEVGKMFDPQPFHVDPEAAAESIFGGLVASGVHSLGISTRLSVAEFFQADPGVANLGGLGMDDVRFHAPVRPGDTLTCELEVLDTRPSESRDDRGYVDFDRRLFNQDDEKVLSVTLHNIVAREAAES
ncbi:MAG: MaoC family dehydratase [Salinirussus sp.]